MALVERSEQSKRDVLAIWVHIAERNFNAADNLLHQFDARLSDIAEMPGMGRERDDLMSGLRSFPVGDYVLFYRTIPGGIELVRVLHGARDLRDQFRQGF
jgi:toxin ParE1/3/4